MINSSAGNISLAWIFGAIRVKGNSSIGFFFWTLLLTHLFSLTEQYWVGIPENSASLWTTYELQKGSLQGLGFGLGFNFVGERQGGLPNSFSVDSYFLTNAALFYSRDNWQARLNFDNLFDVDFIETANTSRTRFIYPGDPFTVRGSVAVEL